MRPCNVPSGMSLRPIVNDDHKWLVELHNDPEVLKNLTHPEPITMAQHMAWWNRVSSDPTQRRMIFMVKVAELDGSEVVVHPLRIGVVKFYGIDRSNQNCSLGADIHQSNRGKGYAKYMWELMLRMSFNDLDLHRVSLTTAAFNNVGQRVYRNLGFREEGRLVQSLCRDGIYHDQICMFMLRDDWR